MAKRSKSSGSGDIKRHLRAQAETSDGPADRGLNLDGAAREIQHQLSNMFVMLMKVFADLEDLAVIRRSIMAMQTKFSELVTRVGDVEKRIDHLESSERELSTNLLMTKIDLEGNPGRFQK